MAHSTRKVVVAWRPFVVALGLLAAVAAAVLSTAAGAAAPAVSCPDGVVTCKACADGGDINTIAQFPRGPSGTADLGKAQWMTCDAHGENCAMPTIDPGQISSAPANSPASYIQGVAIYIVIAIAMAVLTALCGFFFCFIRYCCCCCKGCCWKQYPQKRGGCCGCTGYVRMGDGSWGYPKYESWGVRIYMLIFVAAVTTFILLGQFKGNQGFTSGMQAMVKRPDAVADLVQGMSTPFTNFLEGVTSETVVGLVREVNATIYHTLSLRTVGDELTCAYNGFHKVTNLTPIKGFINQMQPWLNSLTNALNSFKPAVNALGTAQNRVYKDVSALDVSVGDFRTKASQLANMYDGAMANINAAGNLVTAVNDANTGVPSISSDITALGRAPNATFRTDVAENTYTSLIVARDGGVEGTTASVQNKRAVLISWLRTLQSQYLGLPDYSVTAAHMSAFNTLLAQARQQHTLDKATTSVDALGAKVQSLPDTAYISGNLTDLNAAMDDMGLNALNTALTNLDTVLKTRPSVATILQFVRDVKALPVAVNCAADAVDSVLDLANTLADLPFLSSIKGITKALNDSVGTAVKQVSPVEGNLDMMDTKTNAFNIGEMRDQIVSVNNTIKSQRGAVSVNAIKPSLDAVNAGRSFSTANIHTKLVQMNTTLATAGISQSVINSLIQFEKTRQWMLGNLTIVIADLTQLGKGVCNGDATKACAANGDCTSFGGTCTLIGARRCKNSGAVCTQDTGCAGAGDRCLVDPTRYTVMEETTKNANIPDTTSASSTLNSLSANSNFNINSMLSGIVTKATITSALDSTASAPGALAQVKAMTAPSTATFKPADVNSLIDAAISAVNLVDFNSLSNNVNSLDSQISGVKGTLDQVRDVANTAYNFDKILHREIPAALKKLSKPELDAVRSAKGMSGVMRHIGHVADEILDAVGDSTTMFTLSYNVTSMLTMPADITAALDDPKAREIGAIYYLARLANAVNKNTIKLVDPDKTDNLERLDEDSFGVAYPGGAYCLTDACLSKEITYINTAPLKDVTNNVLPVPLSREQVVAVPFIIPALLALLGLLSCLCVLCSRTCMDKWSSCSASCMAGWVCCQMPGMFLLIGSFFTFVILLGDVCGGMENAGASVIQAMGPSLCKSLGGKGPLNDCVITTQNITLHVDIPGVYTSLFGQGHCGTGNAYDELLEQLHHDIGPQFGQLANSTFDSFASSFKLRPLGRDLIQHTLRSSQKQVTALIGDLKTPLSCASINNAYSSMKSVLCCDVGNALFWTLGGWYLIAWSYCVCGCCAGILARKRFRHDVIWYPEDNEDANASGILDEGGANAGKVVPMNDENNDTPYQYATPRQNWTETTEAVPYEPVPQAQPVQYYQQQDQPYEAVDPAYEPVKQ